MPEAKAKVDELERQHVDLHENWRLLAAQLESLVAQQCDKVDAVLIQRFVAAYDRHIAIEEPLFELGKRHLSEAELKAMGAIMSKRRLV